MKSLKILAFWLILITPVFAQYPTLPYHPNTVEPGKYPAPSSPFQYNDYITNVTFAGINNTTGAVLWRNNYSGSTHGSVVRGQEYTISVTVNSSGADFSYQHIDAYIDWDRNGDCGGKAPDHGGSGAIAAECYALGSGASHPATMTFDITVPNDAAIGTTWLRVTVEGDAAIDAESYLGYFGYGEIEEYGLEVSAGTPDVTFANGSAFTPAITLGSANQAIGRFQLTGSIAGASLTAASIKLNGTRTGLSNLKLWGSTDATFNSGSDTQLGSTVAADPGDGSSASFSGFSSAIGTSGTYYFLTGDVSAEATGIVQGVIVANGNLTVSGGTLSGTITNAPLSNGDVSLPVELASFTAKVEGTTIVLNWATASETDNLGFILERAAGNGAWQPIASYKTDAALKGQGNASTTTSYSFIDNTITTGTEYHYRLGDVNTAGIVTMHSPISVTTTALPQSTAMLNAYPNPFNPETTVKYTLHQDAQVTITVYDLLGRKVKTLIDEQQAAGAYHVVWSGTDAVGAKAASGAYLVRMETAEVTQTQKVLLLK